MGDMGREGGARSDLLLKFIYISKKPFTLLHIKSCPGGGAKYIYIYI